MERILLRTRLAQKRCQLQVQGDQVDARSHSFNSGDTKRHPLLYCKDFTLTGFETNNFQTNL